MNRTSIVFTAPRQVELRHEDLRAPAAGEGQVTATHSLISTGTELLIYKGDAPAELAADEQLGALTGSLAFPLKYGYCMVGTVSALGQGVDPAWLGRTVFAFNPHETAFNAAVADLQPLPQGLPEDDAVFLPNMETAVNLIFDGQPLLGERVAVIGQGVVGLLTTALLARHPLEIMLAIDTIPGRNQRAVQLGAAAAYVPQELAAAQAALGQRRADLVYELSGDPAGLNLALDLVGDHGRIVVGSWYGQRQSPIDLGRRFHRGRIRIISSQVTNIEPALRGRWDKARRFENAWHMLQNLQPSHLVTERVPFTQAPLAYGRLASQPQDHLATLLTYD